MITSLQFRRWWVSSKFVSHLKDYLMRLVVVWVKLVPDPSHVGLEERSAVAHIIAGNLGLFEFTASKDIGNRNLGI